MSGGGKTLVYATAAAGVFLAFLLALVFSGSVLAFREQQSQDAAGTVGVGAQLAQGAAPPQYVPLLEQAAQTCSEVTAPLLAAQIEQESGWNPNATSPVGAQGIAQFMPSTWDPAWGDPANPVDAIPAQGRYMCDQASQVQDQPGDTLDLALAAYNAGLGAVQQYGGIPPYPETQDYVRTIRSSAADKAAAPSPGGGSWVTPADGRCSSGFGQRWGSMHEGQDLAGPIGEPIRAAADGTVIASGPASGYGLWVKIQHDDGVVTTYGHNTTNDVQVGDQVRGGQPIAEIGDRGEATGPHVHYQIEVDGKPVDPVSWYQKHGAPPLCGGP